MVSSIILEVALKIPWWSTGKLYVYISLTCVCYYPPVRGVCPNYEVVEFQPRTVTPLKPRLCCLLLRIYYWPAPPYPPVVWCPSGGGSPLLPQHPLHRRPSCLGTGSSTLLGVTYFCPSIPILLSSPSSVDVSTLPLSPSLPLRTSLDLATPARFM